MEIERIACIGAGLIGHGWATLFAARGFSVNLQDLNEDILERALKRVSLNLGFLASKGLMKTEDIEESKQRINLTTSIVEAVRDADYVQESVSESYEVKKTVFKKTDSAARRDAILASSSSALSITEIQKAATKPERCLIAHPWNPPYLIPLVEVIPGERTSQDTVEVTRRLMLKLGKIPVVQKRETLGAIGNRLSAALWREAINLVDQGVADVEDIDRALAAGPALRWTIMGVHLPYHLGGGEAGIRGFIRHLGPSMSLRWKSMDTWDSIPDSAAEKVIQGVENSQIVRTRTMEEIKHSYDDNLAELVKFLHGRLDGVNVPRKKG